MYYNGMLCWYTIFNEYGDALDEVLARSEDVAIDDYLNNHPGTPDPEYLSAIMKSSERGNL